MPSFKCKDMGMKCGFEVKDENRDELMNMVALHADKTHNMKEIPADMKQKLDKVIRR